MNFLAPKIGALQMDPIKQNGSILEDDCNNFDYISVICGDHCSKQTA
jgi:hypothetical protein